MEYPMPERLLTASIRAGLVTLLLAGVSHPAVGQDDPATVSETTTNDAAKDEGKSAEALELSEIRVNAVIEKDQGFAPKEAQTASKIPLRLLETPFSVTVITREVMESRQITNLQQALQTVPGVSPVNFGRRGFDDINIRGFRSSESILIDGLVQSPGMWTRLNVYGFERFEVLRGPASVLYGAIQPGGIVNAISKRPRAYAFSEAGIEFGSFGHRAAFADVNLPLSESGATALRVNTHVMNTDDPTDFVYRKDRWLAPSFSLDLGDDADLVLFASRSESEWLRQQGISPFGTLLPNPNGRLPLSLFTGDPGFGPYRIDQTTVGASVEYRFDNGIVLRHNARYETEDGEGRFVANQALRADRRTQNRTATVQGIDYDLLATDTSVLSRFDWGASAHTLVVGLDARTGTSLLASKNCTIAPLDLFNPVYNVPTVCPPAFTSNAPSTLDVAALYAQDQIKFAETWSALVGVRHDRYRDDTRDRIRNTRRTVDDHDTTFSLGLVNEFRPGWSAYASFAESFRPITGQTFDGRPFDPEASTQWEAGIKHEALEGRVTAALALYELTRENLTTADPVNPGFSIQVGEQRASGAELEGAAELASGWRIIASYAYTDAEVTRDNNPAIVGRPVNLTPLHTFALWSTYDFQSLPGLSAGVGARHIGEQVGALPFTLPSYQVVDLSLAWRNANWRVTAGVRNLTDEVYYDGAINQNVVSPGMPRHYSLTATYVF
jgi:iron complex outermembrane receptor protein